MQTTIKQQFTHELQWADFDNMALKGPYLAELSALFDLPRYAFTRLSTAALLNQLAAHYVKQPIYRFEPQSKFANDTRYYEEIIAQDGVIPTREGSWHDFFNGLIWLQFPSTKKALNAWHMEDIQSSGVHPRTPRRNRLTHFDECGLILVSKESDPEGVISDLKLHDWHSALYEKRGLWEERIRPVIFGHANLEMLLSPYPQLTAKWCQVTQPTLTLKPSFADTFDELDTGLLKTLKTEQVFEQKQRLKPLPLLGIPGWADNQTPLFYANKEVFRPRRQFTTQPVEH
ncbi:DUF3025 domain-containing protein [Alteromonas facilis]|uniref:DUF3025 domain-containing protein n=1 Tax=Alteromonas facilis TaxID=2048004 RepID=UPI000C29374E|nr:DUF3025 domain-containing protein [Alteromonas facilis]